MTKSKTIRASEIGSFLYCKRAWWYGLLGIESENQVDLERGSSFHQEHGRRVVAARLLRLAGWVLLLAALVVMVVFLTSRIVPAL